MTDAAARLERLEREIGEFVSLIDLAERDAGTGEPGVPVSVILKAWAQTARAWSDVARAEQLERSQLNALADQVAAKLLDKMRQRL